mgnify:CR=1 FL=1
MHIIKKPRTVKHACHKFMFLSLALHLHHMNFKQLRNVNHNHKNLPAAKLDWILRIAASLHTTSNKLPSKMFSNLY